jgi:lysophospholipase L1-like esterase
VSIVAIGDSIVAADESWAHWLSRSLERPLRNFAVGGSRSDDVVGQLSRLGREEYAVACLSVGTNDILFDWDAERFADNVATIVATVETDGARVVAPTIPLTLAGFPGTGTEFRRRAGQANAVLERSGALVFSGGDLHGPRTMSPERIHPTPAGQLVLADRAAEVLGVVPVPSTLTDV